jgi:predicted alpha/beta-hydrolase family hydrolase
MAELKIYKADTPGAALVLAHGAGAGQSSAWMVKAAQALSDRGITCATFDFPYIKARRSVPDRAPVLEAHWRLVLDEAKATFKKLPVFIGGKSMGGRISSHIAAQGVDGVHGLIFFGYPLHPPGQPGKRRDAHLPDIKEPMLFIQGSADTFGNEAELKELVPTLRNATLHIVPTGDHSFKVRGGAKAVEAAFVDVIDTAAAWMRALA